MDAEVNAGLEFAPVATLWISPHNSDLRIGLQLEAMQNDWILGIGAIVLPLVATIISVIRFTRSNRTAVASAWPPASSLDETKYRRRQSRWYHTFMLFALAALPFIQWFAYLHFRALRAVVLPLAIVCTIGVLINTFSPSVVELQPPPLRKQLIGLASVAFLLLSAFLPQPTPMILIWRGIVLDLAGVFAMTFIARQLRRLGSKRCQPFP